MAWFLNHAIHPKVKMQIPLNFQQSFPISIPDINNYDGNRLKQVGFEWASEYLYYYQAVIDFLQNNQFQCENHQLNSISKEDCLALTDEIKKIIEILNAIS